MEAKSKWLTEDGNIVAPNTMDSCVFGSDGQSLEEKLPFKFGIDESGEYGYYKTGADVITPFGTGGGTYVVSDLDYSTEEQLTGKRWTDGKPIYQKTIEFSFESSSTVYVDISDDIDVVLYAYGFAKNSKYMYNISMYTQGIGGQFLYDYAHPNQLRIRNTNSDFDKSSGYVTVQYTKTTDTASSPVALPKVEALHNYSTEEKVVGTWIDGRSIFERTWQIDNTTVPSNWDVTNADFENIAFVVEAILYDTDSETPRSVPVKTRKLSSTSIRFYTGDSWGSIDAYMIQYVKTTATPN